MIQFLFSLLGNPKKLGLVFAGFIMAGLILFASILGNVFSCVFYVRTRRRFSQEVIRFALAQENRGLAARRLNLANKKQLIGALSIVVFYLLTTLLAAFLPLAQWIRLACMLLAGIAIVGTVTYSAIFSKVDSENE